MALIQLEDLYKIYNPGPNAVHALDGVSLIVQEGEYLAIVGQSGSGKSTLMNILGCLDVPSSGRYLLDGQDVSSLSDNQLSLIRNKQIGFIFQGFNLVSSLNALENVELPLSYRGMGKKQRRLLAMECLEQVGLHNRMHHRPSQMSGGQQQRVAIARAIAAKPSIILADEPTGNLDSASGREVIQIIEELNRQGRTVILITHDNTIAASAHRIIRLQDGRVVDDHVSQPSDALGAG
ncbi:Macrolide export ATP-binding/permease protein MacB [Eubacteriaceae bacterium CHKCI005]|nr:Macrolide export ATP-binding/permease protein MacB [Eubacteriaceae bacterium CHKCI005]